jgi:hypothetical protein
MGNRTDQQLPAHVLWGGHQMKLGKDTAQLGEFATGQLADLPFQISPSWC